MENAASNSTKKYQHLIFPVVAVLIGLLLLGLMIIPQGLKIPQTNAQIDEVRKSVNALNLKINQLNGVDVNKYQEDLKTSLVALPNEKDIPGVMELIFNLLRNNSLELNGISFSNQDIPASGATMFIIKIDVSGSKDSLINLIGQLKETPRVLKVETLSTATSSTSTSMQILIGLDAFFQPVPASQDLVIDKPVDLPNAKNLATLQQIKDFQARNQATATAGATTPIGKPDPFQ